MNQFKPTMEDSFAAVRHKQDIDICTDINELKAVAKRVVDLYYAQKTFSMGLLYQQLPTTANLQQEQTDPAVEATRAGLFAQATERDQDHRLEIHNHPL